METELLSSIKKDLQIQERQLKSYENCLERCNYIVEVGAYTLACGFNGKPKFELVNCPTQWSEESANANAKMLRKHNVNPHIRVVDKFTWYKEKIDSKKQTIEMLEKLVISEVE
jgi:hypothetical protein